MTLKTCFHRSFAFFMALPLVRHDVKVRGDVPLLVGYSFRLGSREREFL